MLHEKEKKEENEVVMEDVIGGKGEYSEERKWR